MPLFIYVHAVAGYDRLEGKLRFEHYIVNAEDEDEAYLVGQREVEVQMQRRGEWYKSDVERRNNYLIKVFA